MLKKHIFLENELVITNPMGGFSMLEHMIAHHCGPALAGIKPANIVALYKSQIPDVYEKIEKLNSELNCKDIYIEIICECEKRVLTMVYRKKILENQLSDAKMKKFLASFGYPKAGKTSEYIEFLKMRMKDSGFPHEIGVFLGYPLHDIYGFINHPDEGCLLTGEWKVY